VRPVFTLAVVASADGFIARHAAHGPWEWASAEEQDLFLAEVAAADWSIMGRHTHAAADRPERRRIVFSASAPVPDWRRPTQVWLDPAGLAPDDLAPLVAAVRPLARGLILGGTRVHDWFHAARHIDRVSHTVEPVRFGEGLPVFAGTSGPAGEVLAARGYRRLSARVLNAAGTEFSTWEPAR
jgi:dihydrofolate reductase